MKKQNYLIILFFLITTTAPAQISAGGGMAYGFDVKDPGIQLRGVYQINDRWRAGADFIFYLDSEPEVSLTELNLNGHYFFLDEEPLRAYALAGLNFATARTDFVGIGSGTNTETGLNIGAGGEYTILENLSGLAELKYVIGSTRDISQLLVAVGVLYHF